MVRGSLPENGGISLPITIRLKRDGGFNAAAEMNMTINTLIPALRRGIVRAAHARNRAGNGPRLPSPPQVSPLSREETRLAVIEVLG